MDLSPQDIEGFDKVSGLHTNPSVSPATATATNSRYDEIMGGGAPAMQTSPSTPQVPSVHQVNPRPKGVGAAAPDNTTSVASDTVNAFSNAYKQTASDIGDVESGKMDPTDALSHFALTTAPSAVLSPFASIISHLIPKSVKDGGGDIVNYVADKITSVPGATEALNKVNDIMDSNPDLARSFGDGLNAIMLALGGEAAPEADSALTDLSSKGSSLIDKGKALVDKISSSGVDEAKASAEANAAANAKVEAPTEPVSTPASKTGIVSKIKEAINPTLTPEEEVGRIIQGKPSDIPAAQRTFSKLPPEVNPSKMTSQELSNAIQSNIESNLDTVDSHYAGDTTPHQMSEFEKTVGSGKNAVKTNYVKQAIEQLKAHYTATNDAAGLSEIKALEEKAETEGLSSQELNNLAREHGTEMPKAFAKTGEPLSGLNKQATENTRMGLKTTAREMLAQTDPEAAAQVTQLDKDISDAIHTKDLLDKQTVKEAVGVQKNGKPGAIKKWAKENPVKARVIKVVGGATAGRLVGGTGGETVGALAGGIGF